MPLLTKQLGVMVLKVFFYCLIFFEIQLQQISRCYLYVGLLRRRKHTLLSIANIAPGMRRFSIQMLRLLLTRKNIPILVTFFKLNNPSWSWSVLGSLSCSDCTLKQEHSHSKPTASRRNLLTRIFFLKSWQPTSQNLNRFCIAFAFKNASDNAN